MTQYRSRIDPGSDSFVANREEMLALVKKLRDLERRAHDLSERRRPRFEERGQSQQHTGYRLPPNSGARGTYGQCAGGIRLRRRGDRTVKGCGCHLI